MASDILFYPILLLLGAIALIAILWKIFEKYRTRSKFLDHENQAARYKSMKITSAETLAPQARKSVTESEVVTAPYTELNRRAADETPQQPLSAVIPSRTVPPSPENGLMIFISYRRQDSSDVTGRIYDRLVQHFGREAIFKDVDSIPLGIDFRKVLADAVGQCNLLLAVIGRQWLNIQYEGGARRLEDPRDFVRIEIESALHRDIPVIPLLVQGAGAPGENDLPPSLQALVYRNAISIRPDPDFHHDVDRLIKGINQHFKNNS